MLALLVMMALIACSSSLSRAGLRSFRLSMAAASNSSPNSAVTATTVAAQAHADSVKIVRSIMESSGLDAIIVPTEDPHMSEYVAPYFGRREFISGFTGSAGTAILTKREAVLFTDGRYHNQAEMELPQDWVLMKQGLSGVPTLIEYLANSLEEGAVVGIDPLVHAAEAFKKLETALKAKKINLKPFPNTNGEESEHPIDMAWKQAGSRPPKPTGVLREHPIKYAGVTVSEKVELVRKELTKERATALVVTSLDEIAWLLNFRGCDVPCNPVSVAYLVLERESVSLFINHEKVPLSEKTRLEASGVKIYGYERVVDYVSQLGRNLSEGKDGTNKIWFDGKTANIALYNSVKELHRVDKESPIVLMKAIKNDAELQGMRACHLRDGAAMAEFLSELESILYRNDESCAGVTEYDLDIMVTDCRAKAGLFLERSFPTIAGVNGNGAIIHYRAEKETCKTLTKSDMLLLDSGAQYEDGTTDVTRTFHFGEPTDWQKETFTRVLKGNIGLDSRVFPVGTPGCLLDVYAREHLWEIGKNYIHGTGHGVGAALNVHEGPHRISPMLDGHPLKAGMIVSNEPGYYETNNFGIRIENLLEVVARNELGEFAGKSFLGFAKLTHIPIQKKLIKVEMLTERELSWINSYHQDVWEKVSPLIQKECAKQWLREATLPISAQ